MKLKLLLIALLLFTMPCFSQTTAHPVPDMFECNTEVFDLTVNNEIVLGGQDPDNHTVAYFYTQADADANVNAMQDPTFFVPNGMEATVYVRVTYNLNGDYDTTSFNVAWGWAFVEDFPDVVSCGEYVLDPNPPGNYYTGPGGTGTLLMPGAVITTSQTVYIYTVNGMCPAESSFEVTISSAPMVNDQPAPIVVCDPDNTDVLHVNYTSTIFEIMNGVAGLEASVHYYEDDAYDGINALPNPFFSQDSNAFIIYVRVENITTGCFTVVPVTVVEGPCTNNSFAGQVFYDMDANGCTPNDTPAAGIPVQYAANGMILTTYTTATGQYMFSNIADGVGTVTVMPSNMFTAAPASQSVTFPGNTDEFDFCLTVPNPINDIAVTIVPLSGAQAGFPTYYALYYENNGSLPASGTITLTFDGANLVYNASNPDMTVAGNTLTFAYNNLQPFQSGMISVNFTVNVPQITPAGTVLNFTATIDTVSGDANPGDNTSTLAQIVVNSWDPNDITVHEGETITPDEADEYLHYTIRFQNMGNANAVNIAIENPIDTNLDLSTLEPIGASHDYTTTIENGQVRFDFSNINLTWEDNDEIGSQGYVSYRIKPVSSVTLGDYMQGGSAGIFFDFNDPVMTNVVTTTIQSAMGTDSFEANSFVMYPNPASGIVNIKTTLSGQSDVTVTDVLGKTVLIASVHSDHGQLDVTSLTEGLYFVTVTADEQSETQKLLIK